MLTRDKEWKSDKKVSSASHEVCLRQIGRLSRGNWKSHFATIFLQHRERLSISTEKAILYQIAGIKHQTSGTICNVNMIDSMPVDNNGGAIGSTKDVDKYRKNVLLLQCIPLGLVRQPYKTRRI